MEIAEIKFTEWDKLSNFKIKYKGLKKGDYVIVETKAGREVGKIISIMKEVKDSKLEQGFVLRAVNESDLQKIKKNNEQKNQILGYAQNYAAKLGLKMKFIDVYFSFDPEYVKIIFTAEGRIDFRELVRNLGGRLQKTIRMHQIGIRDEAKIMGALGICGRGLCCRKFLKELVSISSDLADLQQVAHRGADRISGVCGRLMCCLNYESGFYKELIKKMPEIGDIVKFENKKAIVIGRHILKQTVNIEIEKGAKVEVELDKLEF
ncbi:stage 0 sporulation family protein [Patescibacteria group bacterium]